MDHKNVEFLNVSSFKESIKDLTKELNKDKAQRSIRNRLLSIAHDAKYVKRVHDVLSQDIGDDIPLIANERCGTWYVNPHETDGSTGEVKPYHTAYFKSTDGHTNEWSFSFKRLNFHLLDLLSIHHQHGSIIVDSTRRGKTIPDALSKTIPIWCATLNYAMFGPPNDSITKEVKDGENANGKNWFFYPERTLSLNEASKITDLIPQFANQLRELDLIPMEDLKTKLHGKYLRPYWIHPQVRESPLPSSPYKDHIPLILCCASERCQDGVRSMTGGWVYVQGAADDEELWSLGLTYKEFWGSVDQFRACEAEEDALEMIKTLKAQGVEGGSVSIDELVKITEKLDIGKIIGDLSQEVINDYDHVIVLSKEFKVPTLTAEQSKNKTLQHFPIQCNKKGSNELRKFLPSLTHYDTRQKRTLILDESGKDLSVGVLLVFLLKYYNLDWELTEEPAAVNKTVIKQHLAKVNAKKVVNPSRATLQSVNSFLM